MSPINVLSLFDGMGCGWIALKELGIPVGKCYSSEVDKFAIRQVSMNFPDVEHLGDIRGIQGASLGHIDLIMGGSACQNLSFAGNRAGLSTKEGVEVLSLEQYMGLKEAGFEFEGQSYLFWEYIRLLHEIREVNPDVLFLMENVEMGKKWEFLFDSVLGLRGVHIDSALVSAQHRKRIYWTNIRTSVVGLMQELTTAIPQPEDRGIYLRDILEEDVDEKYYLSERMLSWLNVGCAERGRKIKIVNPDGKSHCLTVSGLKMNCDTDYVCVAARGREDGFQHLEPRSDGKTNCLTTVTKDSLLFDGRLRVFTPTEYARLQTVPDWYSWEGTSDTQIRKMCGNGWTIEVIKHILSFMDLEKEENMEIKELDEVIKGRGEMKGFTFTQLKKSEFAYLYEVLEEESGHKTYEVFRRRENVQFGCVSYPSSKGFGDYIYMGKCFRDLGKAEDYYAYLNDFCANKVGDSE